MPESSDIIIEGASLEACRKVAARKLGIPPQQIRLKVLQQGKKGLLSSTPFRVRAMDRNATSQPSTDTAVFQTKLEKRLVSINEELERLGLLGQERSKFEEIMAGYEDLSAERRHEVKQVAEVLSDDLGNKVRERISRDGKFALKVSEDGLTCFVRLTPPECLGVPVKLHDVLGKMRDLGLVFGVNHVRIRELLDLVLEKDQTVEDAVVAEGQKPVDGEDGAVKFYVAPGQKEVTMHEDGRVDHRGKAGVTVVKKDQKLALIAPPTEGAPGKNVRGEPIEQKPGEPGILRAGANVQLDTETGVYLSAIDGVLELTDDTIIVHPRFVVHGDVDMSTGNIEFGGDVWIGGTVRDRFVVRAKGDIDIVGGVEGCEIVSETGSIRISKGIAGRNRCFVSAAKDVAAGYIESACVYAGNDIVVGRSVMHAEIVAGNAVLATEEKGAIIGGVTKAGELVHGKRLGAAGEPITEFVVGIDMEGQEHIRLQDQRQVTLKNTAHEVEEVIKTMESGARAVLGLSKEEKNDLADLKLKLVMLHSEIDTVINERAEFLAQITAETRGAVRARVEVHAKVRITIGALHDDVKRMTGSIMFVADAENEQIARKPYRG